MKPTKSFHDFTNLGFVSVWIGDFRTEDDLDDYINGDFASDFGFEVSPRGVREIGVTPSPSPIAKLVEGFSRWETFTAGVVEAAASAGTTQTSCMLIIYNFRYDGNPATSCPQLTFIGAIPFPGFA